ncbi:probable integral membrane protein NMA1898 [hydrothermal vent metagenome]|uniref:Probable integral membrane protein NMA1898 n=1 Tax=hydrothermal vent metagenome TaxID=652676 RepID=A0A1W1EC87_9ZZZZ
MNNSLEAHPKFAVVGHPNKGKSSIVSSLSFDDSIQISDTPGTTTKQRSFPLKVDGKILYELFDTPGFQRARRVLAWLEKHDVSADKKHEVVQMFINEHKNDPKFNDEIELLEPIMNGAGIIYVVDGSKPYGEEYEAEMEILRWTGQPSMALINYIDDSDYSSEWKRALSHYFKMVRTYNPMSNNLSQHILILESMAQLKEEWIEPIKDSIKLFKKYHEEMISRSSLTIAKLIVKSISFVETLTLKEQDATDDDKNRVENNYKDALRKFEVEAQKSIETIWNHKYIEKDQKLLPLDGVDLFSVESASLFGLTKKELLLTATATGAATGAGIDLMLGGSTFLLGSGIGALIGGVGALFAFNELSEIKVLGQSLGNRYLEIGPMQNLNFPYILLGRAIYHTSKIANRSHAIRDVEELKMDSTFKDKWLTEDIRKNLEKCHKKFRSQKEIDVKVKSSYENMINDILKKLIS